MILRIIGVALIIAGTLALAYEGFSYTSEESVVEFGPVEVTAQEKKKVPLHPILGSTVLIGGALLVFFDRRKKHEELEGRAPEAT